MSSNIPFAYPILDISAGNNSLVYVPAFPGAYIYDVYPANDYGSFIPIYTSISDFTVNGFSPLFNDVDNQVIVLPGYSLEMYATANYGGALVYTLDNSGGTDYLFLVAPSINTASSCKLYYTPTSSGIKSLISYQLNPDLVVLSGGGAISYSTVNNINYAVFTFTTTGTMNIRSPVSTLNAEILLVAGGGSGGTANSLTHCAGGGGAGGVAIGTMTLSRNTTYTCTVGLGATTYSTNGSNSTITNPSSQSLLVYGGGAGARDTAAGSGGSGGGAAKNGTATNYLNKGSSLTGSNSIGATVTFYGNAGGISRQASGNPAGGGGGGGAGAVGGDAPANTDQAGAGGNGTTWTFNNTVYGGGGGGGQASNGYAVPPGGSGGGGNGARYSTINATNGTNGRGGGGGGGYGSDFGWGGNGIIIVAIKMSELN
jgi:hypothetical protein